MARKQKRLSVIGGLAAINHRDDISKGCRSDLTWRPVHTTEREVPHAF
jgi:hypothetical protein